MSRLRELTETNENNFESMTNWLKLQLFHIIRNINTSTLLNNNDKNFTFLRTLNINNILF